METMATYEMQVSVFLNV